MKGILIAQKPRDCENIVSGKKTIIVCKKMPKLQTPFKGYIFCTKGRPFIQKIRFGDIAISHTQISKNLYNGKVIGEFICDRIDRIEKRGINNNFDYCYLSLNEWGNDDIEIEIKDIQKSCISKSELNAYGENSSCLYGLHITDLKIYDKPKELSEFSRPCSYDGLCFTCKRFKANGSSYDICNSVVTRPPQGWIYVEEQEDNND